MPDFIILANSRWDSLSGGGGGHSSQQYATTIMARGGRVSYVQRDGVIRHTPLAEMPLDPETIVICDMPWVDYFYELFMKLKAQGCCTVYRIIDNWFLTPCTTYREEREIEFIQSADVVFASNPLNIERFQTVRPDIGLLRNGVDFDLFWHWQGAAPEDLRRGEPTLVFLANFWDPEWTDWASLIHAAESCPAMAINVLGDYERIQEKHLPKSIHLLGARYHHELPAYLCNCDVGVVAYSQCRTRYNNPLKVLEYLAAGLPVVCRPNISVMDYPYLYYYRTPEEFLAKVNAAACAALNREYLGRFLQQHTWEARLDMIGAKLGVGVERSALSVER